MSMVILPCGLQGQDLSCFKNCQLGKAGNAKKIEMCYDLLKGSKKANSKRKAKTT